MVNSIDIYTDENNTEKNYRYSLGKSGSKTLFILAMNPSVATQEKWDQTIIKSFGLSAILGYDSCIIFNLIPYRERKSDQLPISFDDDFNENIFKNNVRAIFAAIKTCPQDSIDILACWGGLVYSNELLRNSLLRIYRGLRFSHKQINWYCLKDTKVEIFLRRKVILGIYHFFKKQLFRYCSILIIIFAI